MVGGCPLWVICGHGGRSAQCPLYPELRTFSDAPRTSTKCQSRLLHRSRRHRYSITSSARINIDNDKVRPRAFGCLGVYSHFKFHWHLDGEIGRFSAAKY
jgi:hypothetical protein